MTSIAHLAAELGLSPGDVRTVLPRTPRIPGLLTDEDAEWVRLRLDPDGVRVAE